MMDKIEIHSHDDQISQQKEIALLSGMNKILQESMKESHISQSSHQSSPTALKQQQSHVKQQQIPKSNFTKQINDFVCDFCLQNNDKLTIHLSSQIDSAMYSLQLTSQAKKSMPELNFFETLGEIYEYIQDNSGQETINNIKVVSIDENGCIILQVLSSLGKKERQKEIILRTAKIQFSEKDYMQRTIRKLSQNIVDLRKEVKDLKVKQTQIDAANKALLSKYLTYGERLSFIADKSDPHCSKFKEYQRRFTKLVQNTTYYSLIATECIPKVGQHYFNTKIMQTVQRNIMIGIGSKFLRGAANGYSHGDFIGFYLYGHGYVWQKSNQRDLNLPPVVFQEGITITTNINMDMGYVNWQICGMRVAFAVIPLQLKAKMLFPIVMLINVNDSVQFDKA